MAGIYVDLKKSESNPSKINRNCFKAALIEVGAIVANNLALLSQFKLSK
jgi:hypothetical protein|tara:strand:+ start:145217 stop:145363 length:147 start_codon:yes stop_codon:yes gene_type:complete